jgi:hypothetical protein
MDARDEGRLAALKQMRDWLESNRVALTVELSTGEYMNLDDMLDFIDELSLGIRQGGMRRDVPDVLLLDR